MAKYRGAVRRRRHLDRGDRCGPAARRPGRRGRRSQPLAYRLLVTIRNRNCNCIGNRIRYRNRIGNCFPVGVRERYGVGERHPDANRKCHRHAEPRLTECPGRAGSGATKGVGQLVSGDVPAAAARS